MGIPIVYLITELDTGGAQKALLQLLSRLDRQRFSPSVACLYNGAGAVAQEIEALGIRVTDVRMAAKWRMDALCRLYGLLRAEHPAILHAHLFHANLLGRVVGRLAGVPIILSTEHTMGMESEWRYWVNRLTHPLVDRVVCVSPQIVRFVTHHVGIPEAKTVLIQNSIDLQRFQSVPDRQDARIALGLPLGHPLICTVARLDPVKRLDILLSALAKLPEVRLVVVGEGPERCKLIGLASELGVEERVQFVGQRQDVLPWLAACDLFVLCSDWEGMPMAVLEAMAAGIPVVATETGGMPDVIVPDVTGRLVPPGQAEALARAIAGLLDDAELRREMGRAGAKRVADAFALDQMTERTVQLYDELLEKSGQLPRPGSLS
jgi:glycosyltransferase involved in cell wall biosynthesis